MKIVPLDLLEELAKRIPERPTSQSPTGASKNFDLERWIVEHGLAVEGPTGWNGGHRWIFRKCPWNSEHRNRSAFIVQFPNGAVAAGCLHNSCRGNDWHALRDSVEPGWRANGHGGRVPTPGVSGDWEPPIPFHEFDLPPFPTETLPDWWRAFVEAEATATQTPVDLSATLTLSVIAASCAKKVAVFMKEDYLEPVNLFTATALPSGARKTSVFAAVTKPMEDYERSESRLSARENARRRSTKRIKESAQTKLQEQAANAKGKERDQLVQEAEKLAAELADSAGSLPTRLIADDCTPETLATLLEDNGGRIAVMSAEGDVFELLAGRYSATRTPNFAVYLKGHAGDQLRIDRRGRTEFVNKPALTVGLAVQPDVIRGLASKPGFRERGLLGRFLYSMPKDLLGRRDTNPPPVPSDIRDAYYQKVLALLTIPTPKDDVGEAAPHILCFDTAARALMQRFEDLVEPQLAEFGELGGMTDWGGKLVGAVGRIAGNLHMGKFAGSRAPWETPISRQTAEDAIRIGTSLIPHAKAAFAEMGADPVVEKAKRILRWIQFHKLGSFARRDLHQAMKGTFKRVAELEPPLAVLVGQGFIRLREAIPDGRQGRPSSPTYEVNPLGASRHAQNPQNTTAAWEF